MRILGNVNTKSKLILILVTSLAALVGLAAVADHGLRVGSAAAQSLYERDVIGLIALHTAEADFLRLRLDVRGIALFRREPARVAKLRANIDRLHTAIVADLAAAAPTMDRDEVVGHLRDARRRVERYYELLPEFFAAADVDDPPRLSRAQDAVKPEIEAIGDHLERFIKAKIAVAGATSATAQASHVRGRVIAWSIGGIGALISLVTSLLIGRTIARPLVQTLRVLKTVGEGDLTVRLNLEGRDELGQMSGALDNALQSIDETLSVVSDNTSMLAASSEELSAVSSEMGKMSGDASHLASAASSAAEQVSAHVQSVAVATVEMGTTIQDIARRATEAAQMATSAVEVARGTNATMTKLRDSSIEIGNVVKLITSIAEQTNLLALNATIEAARAGEAGKGFAVVANEVKELAKQTAKATEEISRTITTIRGDTASAVDAIAKIVTTVEHVNEIGTVIATAVEEQASVAGEIGRSINAAALAAVGIADNISGVARSVQAATMGANQTQTAATELSGMAHQLKGLLGKFVLAGGGDARGRESNGARPSRLADGTHADLGPYARRDAPAGLGGRVEALRN